MGLIVSATMAPSDTYGVQLTFPEPITHSLRQKTAGHNRDQIVWNDLVRLHIEAVFYSNRVPFDTIPNTAQTAIRNSM